MSLVFDIVYGSTTIHLNSDGISVAFDSLNIRSGVEGQESVTGSVEICISKSTAALVSDEIQKIERAFWQARHYQDTKNGDRVYLLLQPDGYAADYQSEMLDGKLELNEEALGQITYSKKLVCVLAWTRRNYWDAVDDVQVPLTNGNGSNNTSGLNVFNCGDGVGSSPNKRHNYVAIAAADVIGDLPSPTRLEMLNNYNVAKDLHITWIGHNWTDPDNLAHIIEGESSTTGTEQDDVTCSNGHYKRVALASGSEAAMFTFALTGGFLDACKGNYYKFLSRFQAGDPANVKFRINLKYNAVLLWQSGQVTLDQTRALQIRDMLTLRLPPYLIGLTSLSALTMELTGQQSTGSPINVDLDFLQVTPLDGWRQLECAGYGVDYNQRLIDDGILGNCYTDDGAGTTKVGDWVGYGIPIMLYPGKKQRLYFLMHTGSADWAEIDRTISVKLFYRPRRKTL